MTEQRKTRVRGGVVHMIEITFAGAKRAQNPTSGEAKFKIQLK